MAAEFEVLQLLSDGELHSGQRLSEQLHVSRAAIWKQIEKLRKSGVAIDTIKGRGYRLDPGIELLDESLMRAELSEAKNAALGEVHLDFAVDSTNSAALRAARSAPSGSVWLAEQQSSGKGRRGRSWVSPFGRNIYLTILWRYAGGASHLSGMSLAVGVCIAEVLAQFQIHSAGLKWPNDVVHKDGKLGGVLIEVQGDMDGECQLALGVGVNVDMSENEGESIDRRWTDLRRVGLAPGNRNTLAGRLLDSLLTLLEAYPEQGFAAYQQRWQALDAFADADVCLQLGDKDIVGIARGVDETGGLRLQTKDGEQVFHGGEISMRAAKR